MKKINWKEVLSKDPTLRKIIELIYNKIHYRRHFSSKNYWEERYKKGGNSGAGSYGELANFKADFLNEFVKKNRIKRVIELGCGDGNQLKMFRFPEYIGLDVSSESIQMCLRVFSKDSKKSFFLYDNRCFIDNLGVLRSDLSLSLDVIYHLVEDEVFEKYMKDLLSLSRRYVIIYSSNKNEQESFQSNHVRHRKFTDWIKENETGWKLKEVVRNKYPIEVYKNNGSFADFYIYEKIK